jgi:hypothetical protein
LERDHAAHLTKGELLIEWPSGSPATTDVLAVRLEAPDGTLFDLGARPDRVVQHRGFVVKIDVGRSRSALDMFVRGDRFKRLIAAERLGAIPDPEVSMIGDVPMAEVEEATDPGLAGGAAGRGGSRSVFADAEPETEAVDEAGLAELLGNLDPPDTDSESLDDVLDSDTYGDDAGASAAPQQKGDVEGSGRAGGPDEVMPEGFLKPGLGEEYVVYVVKYTTVGTFMSIRDRFRNEQRLELEYPEEPARKGTTAQLRLTLPGHNIYQMFGFIANVFTDRVVLQFDENNENFRQACLYLEQPAARNRLKTEDPKAPMVKPSIVRLLEVVPDEDPDKMPIRRRLQRMGMDDKINMALSGGREERMALAVDGNKAIHHYLLRNAKLSLDEIAFMARLPTMNPDVLDKIAENPSYTQNPTVVKALVYNPKTPTMTAIRLLDRLPRSEVMNLAKRSNMNMRLVMAAKKKIEGKRW